MELISVIVPVYNMECYLQRCMESILAQTYQNLEILLVDDGSTDASPALCDAYAKKDARVRVVHQENGGLSAARNAGLRLAGGDYIGYVDSDDWISPDMYETLLHACRETGAELALCRYATVKDGETGYQGTERIRSLTREEALHLYLSDQEECLIFNSVWSKLFHRRLVEDLTFPVGRNSEDILYTTKALCRAGRCVYVDRALYYYVQDRAGSIMNEGSCERIFADEIGFWREHIDYIGQHVSKELGQEAGYYFYKRMLSYALAMKRGRGTRADRQRLERMLLEEKKDIKKSCAFPEARFGDVLRLSVFCLLPALYYGLDFWYDKLIVTWKRWRKGNAV